MLRHPEEGRDPAVRQGGEAFAQGLGEDGDGGEPLAGQGRPEAADLAGHRVVQGLDARDEALKGARAPDGELLEALSWLWLWLCVCCIV